MIESKLLQNCQAGDHKAFKLLVKLYAPKLMGICKRYMKDEFTAQDVLQESFITIFNNIQKYRNEGSFEGWMSKITVRCALQELRKNNKKLVFLESKHGNIEPSIEAQIELEINEEDILKMINRLPEHYRIVFNMYVIEGYSHAEIGELLNIGESTSRTKLTRARRKIQDIYHQMTNLENISDYKYEINK